MKRVLALFFIISILFVPAMEVKGSECPITLDGAFSDWEDMPCIADREGDTPLVGEDLLEMRYYLYNDYLYIYLERKDSSKEGWDITVPILNSEAKGNELSLFLPWENADRPTWDWKSRKVSNFRIDVSYRLEEVEVNINGTLQKVKRDVAYVEVKPGENGDSEYTSMVQENMDKTKIEFRVPLKALGVTGIDNEVHFSVASSISQYEPNIDWIDAGKITITQGPVFGDLTVPVVILSFFGVAILVRRKSSYKNREIL